MNNQYQQNQQQQQQQQQQYGSNMNMNNNYNNQQPMNNNNQQQQYGSNMNNNQQQQQQQQYGSQYGGSQMNYNNQQPMNNNNNNYGSQMQMNNNNPQQQQQQQQQQYGSQYGGSQMNYNNNQQQQQQMNNNNPNKNNNNPNQAPLSQTSQISMVNDKYDQQNLNQYGGNKYGAYGSQLDYKNSAVQDSQINMMNKNNNQQSMTESQMSLADPNRKMKLKPLKWEKPLKKGKTKTQIFIWGKARPPNMFPASSDQLTPYHVDNLSKKKIWDVCAAREGHHCFGIGQNDWCFVWGETKQVGALGLGTNARKTTPFLIRALRKQRVKQACCSAIHSLCITDQMVIYGWGSKLLTLLQNDTKEPTPLNYLNGKGLKKLAAANTHSLAWNPNSIEIWSFGMAGPWLGHDDNDKDQYNKKTFDKMVFDSSIAANDGFSITSADCSSQYTLLILNTGYVGACGINEHGRMGVGKKIQSSAKTIWNRNLQNIVLCSAGSFHAGFVDTEGKVYTCGVGADFRLGHGDKETLWEPKQVGAMKDVQVCQIECVDARTFVITPQGNLIMWGKEPVTGRTHSGPFLYEYLSAYRMYDICGATDFCVAIGIRAKDPIPKPNIKNESVDAMNPNAQMNNMNRLIGDVIGGFHSLGQDQKFTVDSVYSTFIKMKKTVPDNTNKNMVYGKNPNSGIPGPPAPPMNAVYGVGVNNNNNMNNNMNNNYGSQMQMNNNGPPQNVAYGSQMQMGNNNGPPPNVVYGSQYGGSQMQMGNNAPAPPMNNNGPPPNVVYGSNMNMNNNNNNNMNNNYGSQMQMNNNNQQPMNPMNNNYGSQMQMNNNQQQMNPNNNNYGQYGNNQ